MLKIYPYPKSIQKFRAACTWCALIFFGFYLLKNTGQATEAVTDALNLCVTRVIPSLFPYMVLSSLILTSGLAGYLGRLLSRPCATLFALNGNCAAAVILGLSAGFPIGAKTAAETYTAGLCDRDEAQRLCAFCNNTGPAFVIGAVGAGFFEDPQVGVALYLIQAVSALLTGLALSIGKPRTQSAVRNSVRFQPDFPGAVRGAVNGVLGVCGFVVFFSVLTQTLRAALSHTVAAPLLPFVAAICEVTCGTSLAAQTNGCGSFLLAAFAIGWSGVCVHAQSAPFLLGAGLSMGQYLRAKALQGVICALLAALLCFFSQNV